MANTGAYILVVGGGIVIYAAFNHKRVSDVILMRDSTLPASSNPTAATGGTAADEDSAGYTGGGATRGAIIQVCEETLAKPAGTYEYDPIRPMPASILEGPYPIKTDCSGYATLTYKAAGLNDPNGLGYSGAGYTGTLEAKGRRVSTPSPGDLAFWSDPDHVGVCDGHGNVYEFGAPPGPVKTPISQENTYHAGFVGYRSYITGTPAANTDPTGSRKKQTATANAAGGART